MLFEEPAAGRVASLLQNSASGVIMSTVNYAEALILTVSRFPRASVEVEVARSAIRLVPVGPLHAEVAAAARLRYPLNLGDCFAYALAKTESCPLLTLDRDFLGCDIRVLLP
jgi:ribonuclease VapC